MFKTLGFCATVVASIFHRENPIPKLQTRIEKAYQKDASLQDYGDALFALDELEFEIERLKKAKDLGQLEIIFAWTKSVQGEGLILDRLRELE